MRRDTPILLTGVSLCISYTACSRVRGETDESGNDMLAGRINIRSTNRMGKTIQN